MDQDRWIEDKLAVLRPAAEWRPDGDAGLRLLRRGQQHRERALKRRAFFGAAATVGAGTLLAFPGTKVAAERCLDACVAGTSAIGELLGIGARPDMPLGSRIAAPEFRVSGADGNPVTLAEFRGRVVVLNFWATWCPPCKAEIPWFIEFQQEFGARGLAVIGISMDEDGWQSVMPFLSRHRVNYRVALGTGELTKEFGGVASLPTTFLIDKAGRIASVHTGLVPRTTYETEIGRLLAE